MDLYISICLCLSSKKVSRKKKKTKQQKVERAVVVL